MPPAAIASIIVALLVLYVVGIFVYDYRRRKKGKPSLFVDVCESEDRGSRLVKAYRKRYGRKGK